MEIKSSKRGLTFSLPFGTFAIGSKYNYTINKSTREITISASENGKYVFSRKKSGNGWKPLVDLRSSEVRKAIADAEKLTISIKGDRIVVSNAEIRKARVIEFPRSLLRGLRMVSGLNDATATGTLLDYSQISFDEYLAQSSEYLDVPQVAKDLSDVYTVVSLFSGAGILDYPFSIDERFALQYAIDYEAAACETYRKNIGMHIVNGDVHKAFTEDGYPLDKLVHDPDVIIGGPSCKPFSNANRHTRLDQHPDSDLVVQYMRIIRTLRPKVFAMENVPEVLSACDGAYFDAIKQVANECGYSIEARVVQDCKVGGFTTRKRAVILGSRISKPTFRDVSMTKSRTVGDAFRNIDPSWENYGDVSAASEETKRRMSFVPQGGNYTSIPAEYQTAGKNRHSSTYRRLALDEPSPTIVNWRKPPLIHPTENRTLTVAEAKALHGLPANFKICGTLGQMQQQVGNSVPVAIGKYIKSCLLSMLSTQAVIA